MKETQLNKKSEATEKDRENRELENRNRDLKSQVDRLREEKLGVEGNMDGALKTAHTRIDSLQDVRKTEATSLLIPPPLPLC